MTRSRWMLGALGALATVALAPALPASASPAIVNAPIKITDSVGEQWAANGAATQVQAFGQTLSPQQQNAATNWVLVPQADGSTAIRNIYTQDCVEAIPMAGGQVRTAFCDPTDQNQQWVLRQQPDGRVVISPEAAPQLAITAVPQAFQPQTGVLQLAPLQFVQQYDGAVQAAENQVFELNQA